MPQVEIISEHEQPRGWTFQVKILTRDGSIRQHQLALSWADYNHWSSEGIDPPSAVAEAVMTFLVSRAELASQSGAIDAATIRRQYAGADEAIRAMLE